MSNQNDGVTVTLEIQDGIKMLKIPFDIPVGIDPRMAAMAVQQTLTELHDLAPLLPTMQKAQVAMGLFGDHAPIARIRRMLLEAPQGASWGIQIVEPPRVLANPNYRKNESPYISARARISECQNINEIIGTLTCFALLTSPAARGLAALHGFVPKIVPPQMPDGWSGAPNPGPLRPNGVHERKLKIVPPEGTVPFEPGDDDGEPEGA